MRDNDAPDAMLSKDKVDKDKYHAKSSRVGDVENKACYYECVVELDLPHRNISIILFTFFWTYS